MAGPEFEVLARTVTECSTPCYSRISRVPATGIAGICDAWICAGSCRRNLVGEQHRALRGFRARARRRPAPGCGRQVACSRKRAAVVWRVGLEQIAFHFAFSSLTVIPSGPPAVPAPTRLQLCLLWPRQAMLHLFRRASHHHPPTRLRGLRPRPLFGGGKSRKLSPAGADKELDCGARRRMRPAARIWATSARRSAAVMRSGDKGLGPTWVSYMATVRDQLMISGRYARNTITQV